MMNNVLCGPEGISLNSLKYTKCRNHLSISRIRPRRLLYRTAKILCRG